MVVDSKEQAWKEADKLIPTDYEEDTSASKRAGYPIYRSTNPDLFYTYICDLGDRLEVNLENGKSTNVWIKDKAEEIRKALAAKTAQLYPNNF